MDGKLSSINRRLLEDSLDEYRFYSNKIKEIEKDIESYITEHFQQEYELLIEIPSVK